MIGKKFIIAAVAAAVILGAGTVAYARYGHARGFGFGWHGERGMAQLEARLKLSPDQSKQLRDIVSQQRGKIFDRFAAGRNDRQALIKEIFRDNPNPAEIQKRAEVLKQQHAQMLDQLVATGLEANKVFTPEQRTELQKAIDEKFQAAAQRRERFKQHMEERPRPETTPK